MLANLLGGFIVILVGVSFMPVVADQVVLASANLTGSAATILNLTPVFFALGIMTAGINVALIGLRNAGMLGA